MDIEKHNKPNKKTRSQMTLSLLTQFPSQMKINIIDRSTLKGLSNVVKRDSGAVHSSYSHVKTNIGTEIT